MQRHNEKLDREAADAEKSADEIRVKVTSPKELQGKANAVFNYCSSKLNFRSAYYDNKDKTLTFTINLDEIHPDDVMQRVIAMFREREWRARHALNIGDPYYNHLELVAPPNWAELLLPPVV